MEINNASRKFAKEFGLKMGWGRVGNGNFFRSKNGDLYNITLTSKGKVESRQFRLDCDYLISLDVETNSLKVYKKGDLKIGGVTRIGADGMKYYQAEVK